jgi:hypothetical protein
MASSATLALKSGEWFFRFVIWDHFFHKLIHINYCSEILRPLQLSRRAAYQAHVSLGAHVAPLQYQAACGFLIKPIRAQRDCARLSNWLRPWA